MHLKCQIHTCNMYRVLETLTLYRGSINNNFSFSTINTSIIGDHDQGHSVYLLGELENKVTIANTGSCSHVCRKLMTKYCFLEPVVTCTHHDHTLIKTAFCEFLFKARLSWTIMECSLALEMYCTCNAFPWLICWQCSPVVLFTLIAVEYNNYHDFQVHIFEGFQD